MTWRIFLSYAVLASSILSWLIGYLLWKKRQPNAYANRLLSLLLLAYGYIGLIGSLLINGAILQVPHLFRTAAPLHYVTGPLLFLYVRASLYSETRFDRRFLWLFLPAVFNFIELIPFYLNGTAYKIAHLKALPLTSNSLTQFAEGWLPAWVNPVGYTLSGIVYAVLAGLLLRAYLRNESRSRFQNVVYANWIKTFVLIHLGANLFWFVDMLVLWPTPWANVSINAVYVMTQLTVCLYILQRPTLLYGAYRFDGEDILLPLPDPAANGLTAFENGATDDATEPLLKPVPTAGRDEWEEDVQDKLRALEQYMSHSKPYLQPRLSLANVSVATNLPPHLLSSMLNRMLALDFRDYVNAYRVRHVCELLQAGTYNHLTLEGISAEAGFSSKATFYRAFQKHIGLTPAQYLQRYGQPSTGDTTV